MKYDKIKVEAGRAWPVNPVLKNDGNITDEERRLYNEFQVWLSTQPELHTNASDDTYPVDEFGEVVWQVRYWNVGRQSFYDWENTTEDYAKSINSSIDETRAFLPYIGPKKQERDGVLQGQSAIDFASNNYICNEPATPEQKGVEQGERKFTDLKAELGLNNNLEPCPFCGGTEGEQVFLGQTEPDHFIITCICCSVRMKHDRKDKVIGIWNNRESLTDFN